MGYSSQSLVEQILANALTRGTASDFPVEIINIGNQLRDTVSATTVTQYIRWADEEIDAALSVLYQIPLKRIVRGEYFVMADIDVDDDSFNIEDTTRFYIGDLVCITDGITSEKKIIESIDSETVLSVTESFDNDFSSSNTKAQRIGYPDPIPLISARFAAANLYDKYFSAQASPNVSDYGKTLRAMGENDLNSVLNGRILLIGQKILGRRFFNPALLDVNAIASTEKNREKPQ